MFLYFGKPKKRIGDLKCLYTNELVRDKISDIIKSTGEIPHCHILSNEEYFDEPERKLNEECAEYHADKSIEELADMFEVTKTLGIVEVEPTVWKLLTDDEKAEIGLICEEKLGEYYKRFK